MAYTWLNGGFWEYTLDCVREFLKTVYATNQNITYTTVLKVGHYIKPEVSNLTLRYIHTKKILVARLVYT